MGASLGLTGIILLSFKLCLSGSSLVELPAVSDRAALLFHPGCVIRYNAETRQPDWVSYKLTAEEVRATEATRTNAFRPDPEVKTRLPTAKDSDYARSGYDRGHLAPAADMKQSMGAMVASFFLSNISPQSPSLNRGTWSKLEEAVRREALRSQAVYLASGPVFYEDRVTRTRTRIGPSGIPVPDAFFKVLLVRDASAARAIAFILPNDSVGSNLFHYAMSVDEAERITGLDFFRYLPDEEEAAAESSFDESAWFTE